MAKQISPRLLPIDSSYLPSVPVHPMTNYRYSTVASTKKILFAEEQHEKLLEKKIRHDEEHQYYEIRWRTERNETRRSFIERFRGFAMIDDTRLWKERFHLPASFTLFNCRFFGDLELSFTLIEKVENVIVHFQRAARRSSLRRPKTISTILFLTKRKQTNRENVFIALSKFI